MEPHTHTAGTGTEHFEPKTVATRCMLRDDMLTVTQDGSCISVSALGLPPGLWTMQPIVCTCLHHGRSWHVWLAP